MGAFALAANVGGCKLPPRKLHRILQSEPYAMVYPKDKVAAQTPDMRAMAQWIPWRVLTQRSRADCHIGSYG